MQLGDGERAGNGGGGGVQLKSSSGGAEIVGKIESTPLFKVVLGI